jgi:hypothetical protein
MKRLLLVAALYVICAVRCEAQFIGYVAPQTESQILATNVACTGALQNFSITNLGQSSHVLSFSSSGANGFRISMSGSWDGTNFAGFSDEITALSGFLQATGYYPVLRVTALCATNAGTFSIQYSGTPSYQIQSTGFADRATYTKILAQSFAANVNSGNISMTTPFGSSAAVILFQYTSNIPAAGGTFTLTSNGLSTAPITLLSGVALNTSLNTQTFLVPVVPSASLTFAYTSGGASASTYNVEVVFFKPGNQLPSADPCQSQWGPFVKQSSAIVAGAAATTQIIPANLANISIYVCGYQVSQVATAGTLQWISGTGVSCGTGTGNLTGAMGVTASQPISYSGPGTIMKVPQGNALCLTTTGAGGTAAGIVTYVFAP